MRAVDPHDASPSYAAVLDALPLVSFILRPDGSAVYLSRAWQAFTGFTSAEGIAKQPDLVHPDDRAGAAETWQVACANGTSHQAEFRLRMADGSYRWVRTQTDPLCADDGSLTGWIGIVTDLSDLRRAEEASLQAAREAATRDLRERYRIDVGLRTLAEAGAAIYESLDFKSTMRNVAEAVVGSFAAFCTVDALGEDGRIESVAAAHRDPSLVPLIERAAEIRNAHPDHPVAHAIRSGKVSLIEDLPKTWWDTYGQRSELGPQMDALDMRSVIYVPIRSQQEGTIRGALTCILAGADPRETYTAEDVRFAEEVAVRAGLAFDHARAYERERRIAVTLQGASLPKLLPTLDHLYLSADYRPGKSEATIGGDWYDAFALDDDRVAITVGDVVGNGLAAAVTMGRLRQSMRAVATLIAEPNAMLEAADRTVTAESDETYATAFAGVFDPRTHQFTFASAGHPSPVLRHPDGRIETFEVPGLMLGLRRGIRLPTVTIDLTPGTTIVFFTDGLIEATRDIDEGLRRLHVALADARVASAENPAHALVEHVLAGRPATDDIAVLIAEVGPSKRFDERLRTAAMVALDHEQVAIATAAT